MSHFDNAIVNILEHEGGFVNNPADPGGATNFGICQRVYPMLDIKHLTKQDAINIYRRDYWRPYYEEMPYRIAAKVFDMSVNMGHGASHKILQRAANCVDDGIIGKFTLSAIAKLDVDQLLDRISDEQKGYYQRIIDKRPASAVFAKGWTKRANWQPVEVA